MNLDPLASYVKQREGQRVIRKILLANNGMAAVKAPEGLPWGEESFLGSVVPEVIWPSEDEKRWSDVSICFAIVCCSLVCWNRLWLLINMEIANELFAAQCHTACKGHSQWVEDCIWPGTDLIFHVSCNYPHVWTMFMALLRFLGFKTFLRCLEVQEIDSFSDIPTRNTSYLRIFTGVHNLKLNLGQHSQRSAAISGDSVHETMDLHGVSWCFSWCWNRWTRNRMGPPSLVCWFIDSMNIYSYPL